MSLNAIVSYDDTTNDHDALMLGRLLADAGANLTLAYVRHSTQSERSLEELEEHEAEALLERGARWLGEIESERRIVVSPSTGKGLEWLAEQEEANLVIFGSHMPHLTAWLAQFTLPTIVAVVATVSVTRTKDFFAANGQADPLLGLTHGFQAAFLACSLIAAAGVVAALTLLGRPRVAAELQPAAVPAGD